MKKIIPLSIIILFIGSCANENTSKEPRPTSAGLLSIEKRDQLKTAFGRSLAVALAESVSFRKLVKNEALKMFDNDYDVLYYLIKDRELKGGQTVRELLVRNMTEEELTEIEEAIPLLTIFVPELPEETFSAERWDIDLQIPSVGVELKSTNDVPIIDARGTEFTLQSENIPAFPVVVVKENERILTANSPSKSEARGRTFRSTNVNFVFLADCFDRTLESNLTSARTSIGADAKLIDAYNINYGTDGWHRDYIYYNITPSQQRGPFSYQYAEHLRSFWMKNAASAATAYSKIADQTGDPKLLPFTVSNAGWTGGFYEFKVRALLNAKNGIGEELITYFSARPDDLFIMEIIRSGAFFRPTVTGTREMPLNLPLFPWDLDSYAASIKIEIEEVDVTETIVVSDSRSVKFANNFGFDTSFGEKVKIGMKFGTTLETTTTQTVQKTYSLGNDALGSVIVNFADNVLVSTATYGTITLWKSREYSTGWFTISVEPTRVQ